MLLGAAYRGHVIYSNDGRGSLLLPGANRAAGRPGAHRLT
jgi:hypothetical protein